MVVVAIEQDDHLPVTAIAAEAIESARRQYIGFAVRTIEFLFEHSIEVDNARRLTSLPVELEKRTQIYTDLTALATSAHFDIAALPCSRQDFDCISGEVAMSITGSVS